MRKTYFEALISEAIAALPPHIRRELNNVAFVIEKRIRPGKEGEAGIRKNETLLGLFEGIPKTKRGLNDSGALPDKITIFQESIEELCDGRKEEIKELVREVVWHEIGHHFGFDEKGLRSLETRKRKNKGGSKNVRGIGN
jgi:predicted Zn-dependent protease with MMP-like domain